MKYRKLLPLTVSIAAVMLAGGVARPATPAQGTGTIKGHVRLAGKPSGNTVVRMGVDPMCGNLTAGKRVFQEAVLTTADGGLKNAFVNLKGSFPQSPVPSKPVVLDQRGCVYVPRVIGMRVGQTLQIRNDDPLLHNVHSVSNRANNINVGQATAGIVSEFRPRSEEIMIRFRCDIHNWMTAFVGVVNHPYFAVSGEGGTFQIDNVPTGTHTIQVWHEKFGMLTKTVRVQGGAVANIDFSYSISGN